jgi:hypothetical protein
MKLEPLPHTIYKIWFKRINDLNAEAKTLKLSEEKKGGNFHNLGLDKSLRYDTQNTSNKREKVSKLSLIKIKILYTSKDNIKKWKDNLKMIENTCKSQVSDKDLVSRIYKEILQFNKKINSSNKNEWRT